MGKTLGIDIYTDIFITYFFFRCGCKKMEEVTELEYINGLKYFGCNNLDGVKKQIINTKEKLLDLNSKDFKDFYRFLFVFNTNKLYLKNTKCQGLNKDQWECFLDFLLEHGSTFPKKYNCDSYFPLIIDKFYEWYCDTKKIPRAKNVEEDE